MLMGKNGTVCGGGGPSSGGGGPLAVVPDAKGTGLEDEARPRAGKRGTRNKVGVIIAGGGHQWRRWRGR